MVAGRGGQCRTECLQRSVDASLRVCCTHKIRKDLPHLKAVIQYLGTPPAEEGVHEVSARSRQVCGWSRVWGWSRVGVEQGVGGAGCVLKYCLSLQWSRVVALGFEEGGVELERRTKLLSPGHCCTLIYTVSALSHPNQGQPSYCSMLPAPLPPTPPHPVRNHRNSQRRHVESRQCKSSTRERGPCQSAAPPPPPTVLYRSRGTPK